MARIGDSPISPRGRILESVLVGRDSEREQLAALVSGARSGRGGALVLVGEPGIGKSALLADAIARADGLAVLSARGIESESELAFSALADLLRPLLPALDELPEPQRAALASALAVGEPVAAERFTVAAGTLTLLAAGAARSPVLVAVDDLHWLDSSSLEALLFAARRLHAERIAFLLASRLDDLRFGDLTRLELAGLDERAARQLLARSDTELTGGVADALVTGAGGNPLALLELPNALSSAQLQGRDLLDDPLPLGPALQAGFVRRLEGLPEETRLLLLTAAADDSTEIALLGDPASLAPAERAGLVAFEGGTLVFRHPLIRSAVYHSASPAERRAAHRALAGSLSGARRAWHLAAATVGTDEEAAATLEEAAAEARARSGYAAAAKALERAGQLSPGEEQRAGRLLLAADDRRLAGDEPGALVLIDQALALARNPLLRADLEALRGRLELFRASTPEAYARLVAAAERVEPLDPARATAMLADAAMAAPTAEAQFAATEAARRARDAAAAAGRPLSADAELVVAEWLADVAGEFSYQVVEHRWDDVLGRVDDLALADRLIRLVSFGSYEGVDYELPRRLLRRIADTARRASAGSLLAAALTQLTLLELRANRWAAAEAAGTEALALAEATGSTRASVQALVYLARMEAMQGREEECREHARRAWQLAEPLGLSAGPDWHGNVALGLLELGLGRPEPAVEHFERAVGDVEGGELAPGIYRAAGDLAEAYVRSGRTAKAEQLVAVVEERARPAGRVWALAAAARCRGLLADDDAYDAPFLEALDWHAQVDVPFERARTQLCYGERLRRGHRRLDAREQLRAALETFESLGSRSWAGRARAELTASGEHLRRRDPFAGDQLTPQELQLALVVAEGATNKEAAAQLFISPKTVEAHLGAIYRKLGIRSRTELASARATWSK